MSKEKILMDEPSLPVLGLVAFLIASLSSFALSYSATRIAWQSVALKLPNPGRLYRSNAVRIGGIAILPAVLIGMLLTSADLRSLLGIVVCATVITGIGLADDIWDMPPVGKLLGQCAVAVAAVAFGVQIEVVSNPFGGAVELEFVVGASLTVFWLVGMMNAINLLDGLDGLAPGVV
ncbi:MAG: undecaprenyl/decaprenyl-phosphate alpha-N-acetylglucosaminyl 1-phosphate transferase, partial [Chloroflexi bacterium]|nr:undecaprenyl/decaprenyl-phosphate alpha-N-acetylglucosaminyl 1-phosphate transferase [Chloroflexota bacterium]